MTEPKMMFAFESAALWTISAASLTSNRPRSRAAGDVEQDAGGALDGLLEQRAGDRLLGGLGGAVLAAGLADAHERRAGVGHDRAHVGEVEVDEAGDRDQVGDALDALAQDVVGLAEGLEDASCGARRSASSFSLGMTISVSTTLAQAARCPPRPGACAACPRSRTAW